MLLNWCHFVDRINRKAKKTRHAFRCHLFCVCGFFRFWYSQIFFTIYFSVQSLYSINWLNILKMCSIALLMHVFALPNVFFFVCCFRCFVLTCIKIVLTCIKIVLTSIDECVWQFTVLINSFWSRQTHKIVACFTFDDDKIMCGSTHTARWNLSMFSFLFSFSPRSD